MDVVAEIKSKLPIEDVISEYVQLKRAGRNYKGLSPFTSEKTASFIVSPEKQIWHDFSSGKGGDVFSFVMELEGLDFRGALELLARRAGVDLEQYQNVGTGMGKLKDRLYAAHELAAKFYQTQFKQHQQALKYIFKKRQFTKEAVLAFRLGYSPNTGTALLEFLKKKGFSEEELQKAGLITKNYRGVVDMFRGRIQIPLADPQGRIVGFTARQLTEEDSGPKYLNTPQTLLYDKGRHVYGLHLAKEAIRKEGFVVLAEGNLDVIASHQAGVRQVVATAGTALTEMQLKALGRFTPDIRLAFDQDSAGLNAAERAIPLAAKADVSLSIITIPSGKDPDELIRSDPAAWEQAIGAPKYALDWLIDRYASQLDLGTGPGKRQFSDAVLKVVQQLSDQVEQDHYVAAVAERLGVSKAALERKLQSQATSPRLARHAKVVKEPIHSFQVDQRKTQNHFLTLMYFQSPLRTYMIPITTDMLLDEPAQHLLKFLQEHPRFAPETTPEELETLADYVKILSLQFEELYQDLELLELRNEAARLQVRLIEQYVKIQKQPLTTALAQADEAEAQKLLEKAKKLDSLLNRHKS